MACSCKGLRVGKSMTLQASQGHIHVIPVSRYSYATKGLDEWFPMVSFRYVSSTSRELMASSCHVHKTAGGYDREPDNHLHAVHAAQSNCLPDDEDVFAHQFPPLQTILHENLERYRPHGNLYSPLVGTCNCCMCHACVPPSTYLLAPVPLLFFYSFT